MQVGYRRLAVPVVVGAVGLLAAGVFWLAVQSTFRFALWDSVSGWRPTGAEYRRLDDCRPSGWWTWLKVMAQDHPVPCGEVWAIQAVAEKVHGEDRADWLRAWVASPDSSALRRLRSALALNVAGRTSPVEPAWLALDPALPDWPGPGMAAAVAQGEPWGVHLGPRWIALGDIWAMAESGQSAEKTLPPLEAVWATGSSELAEDAARAVARGLGAPLDVASSVRSRRERGLPSGVWPDGWARVLLSGPECAAPCLEQWIELLRLEAERRSDGPPNDPAVETGFAPVGELLGVRGARLRALGWWVGAATRWVAAAPNPAARLASLGLGAEDGVPELMEALWRRGGTPWISAVVLVEVGQRAGVPVELREDSTGGLWASIGEERIVGASCGGAAGAEMPEGPPLERRTIDAAALAEVALMRHAEGRHREALRLARAAERLDAAWVAGLRTQLGGEEQDGIAVRVGRGLVPAQPAEDADGPGWTARTGTPCPGPAD